MPRAVDASDELLRYWYWMLDFVTIERIATKAAKAQVPSEGLQRVVAQQTTDSEGKDALRITLVLTPEAVDEMTGDAALDLLVALQRELQKEGEERFAVVEYATEAELKEEDCEEGGAGKED